MRHLLRMVMLLLLSSCNTLMGPPTNEDLSPLKVINTFPANGQQGTGSLNVNVAFNEKVLALLDINSAVKVKNLTNVSVTCTVDGHNVDPWNKSLSFWFSCLPSAPFSNDIISITLMAKKLKSADGSFLDDSYNFSYGF